MDKAKPHFYQFIIILMALLSFDTHAQLPDSVALSTDASWIIRHSETVYGYNPLTGNYEYITTDDYSYYRSGSDTLINGNTYTQLLGLPITSVGGGVYTSNPLQSENYVLAYRNDMNRRAFMVEAGSTTESLWYDFTPGLGDTLWNPIAIAPIPYFVVSDIDSVDYCGTMYEQFHYDNYNYSSIQRVGRSVNFFQTYSDPYIADVLVSFCEASVPFASIAGVDEASNDVAFHLFPNPAEDLVELSMEHDIVPSHVLIHDLMGNLLFSDQGGSNSISIGHLASGNYIVSVVTDQGVKTQKLIKK